MSSPDCSASVMRSVKKNETSVVILLLLTFWKYILHLSAQLHII